MTFAVLTACFWQVSAALCPEYSTAGFFRVENTGRDVYSMNPGWKFHKGPVTGGAESPDFDDSGWETVSLPNGIEYLPLEASGCVNYQGEVWYRKHFSLPEGLEGKKLFLHFEAIMGKSRVWINGTLVNSHFGGFLPVISDITPYVSPDGENVVAVLADNSDDPSFPPGKAQDVLDYAYFGGIYRDCWLVAHNPVYITDPNYENETAGGGLFVSFGKISETRAGISLQLEVKNETGAAFSGRAVFEMTDRDGNMVAETSVPLKTGKGRKAVVKDDIILEHPRLWSPESPYLYDLYVYVRDNKGNTVDGYRQRIGVRSIEFKGEDGFWLNGKPYEGKLMGANRHQDFAMIGNALSNSLHYRDAKKLRDAGMKVIRNAHYPQDPAFMDACDELGLFVIVNTPGWQFWNDAPEFGERVYSDIRNMVRRDRNHACVWLWEPILNETSYPADFARRAKDTVEEEYPHPYCHTACDSRANGNENYANGNEYYQVKFGRPTGQDVEEGITYFVREWGDNVDDWNSHNSPSRVNRAWGEVPMLIQAEGYALPEYLPLSYDVLCRDSRQHVGGTLWHSFDHQRGYHPDPFYGGIMDAFRQPKYSYYMFQSQRSPEKSDIIADNGPVIFIANAMTPFSPEDVTVYTNCDEVRLTCGTSKKVYHYKKDSLRQGMPSPPVVFEDVFHVMEDKALARERRHEESFLLAEGFIDGKVVAVHKVCPARRPSEIRLTVDDENMGLEANGADYVTVVAEITDADGNVKRLNNSNIHFTIEGEGEIVGDASIMANPRPVQWGSAPVLIRSTETPGRIAVHASVIMEGSHMPLSAVVEMESVPARVPMIYDPAAVRNGKSAAQDISASDSETDLKYKAEIQRLQRELNALKLKEVERQQSDFELTRP